MKKLLQLSACLFLLILSVNVSAQMLSWEIKQHSNDLDLLKKEVNEYIKNGYVPLGITYDNVELYILYLQERDFGLEGWLIEWYDGRDEIQNGITENMNNGYIPTGITYTGDLFYVLYVKAKSSADAWQLIPSGTNLKAVQRAIQPIIDQGYVPVGITAYQGEYWTLLLLIPDTTVKYWRIESYETGAHIEGINRNIEQGYMPWGLIYRHDRGVDILYVGF
ncbi:hypothetical protein U27_06419 [Candidatus Vecturithrix granuli]|uniref:Uncharacterized protein n=1 Tax=Vecturithrix granuli TaxID=1499967 RepID=A0A081C4C9_VECG1|nr:hypothetical protein U27_06419 [Candidatus Vecturithrix granuli]